MTRMRLTDERMENVVLTDERLDDLAERFIGGQVRELLQISFENYILNPDRIDQVVADLKSGKIALQRRSDEKCLSVVEIQQEPVQYRMIMIPLGRN